MTRALSQATKRFFFDFCNSIQDPNWRWVVQMLATYGLRNYEPFRLSMEDFPVVRVVKGKTGKRFVVPLFPEWADTWNLQNICLPNIDTSFTNSKIGTKVSGWFFDHKAPFSAYNLRHSYARLCFEFDIAPDRAAKFMGHSLLVHLQVYRAWFDESVYLGSPRKIDHYPLICFKALCELILKAFSAIEKRSSVCI